MNGKTPVVLIVALGHSGSHLLSQLLGAHSRCLSIGELHNFEKFTRREHGNNVLADYTNDPVFDGLTDAPPEARHALILANARRQDPQLTTLIDNSKRESWLRRLLANPTLDVRPVHLIRDPRALVRYWSLAYDSPRRVRQQRIRLARLAPWRAATLSTCEPFELYKHKWLIRNKIMTRWMARAGHPDQVVTYHDLATAPESTLSWLMPRLGLEFEPGQLRYGDARQHGTLKTEYQAVSARSEIRLDLRWQADLNPEVQARLARDPEILDYLNRLGLVLHESGLSRREWAPE